VDPRLTREWLARLVEFLAMRQRVLGASRHAVNIVWDLPDTLDAATREKLMFLCREANHRLVVMSDASSVWATEPFEEVRERLAVRRPSVLDTAWRFVVSVVYGERDFKRDWQTIRRISLTTWAGLCAAAKVTAVEAARYYGIGRAKAKIAHDKLAAAKAEMQRKAAETRARHAEEARRRRIEEEKRAHEQAERRAQEEAARKVREEEERKRREAEAEAKRRATEEAARKRAEEQAAKAASERQAREEAESRRRAQEDSDRKAREENDRRKAEERVRQEAERRSQSESDRKAREDAQRRTAEDRARKEADEARRRVLGDAVGSTPVASPVPPVTTPGANASAGAPTAGMFKFRCPRCGQRLAAEVAWVGDEIQCPSCEGKIVVPKPSA
jgi:DNA-directed RNA polymerase subunit RPC12/RpoP